MFYVHRCSGRATLCPGWANGPPEILEEIWVGNGFDPLTWDFEKIEWLSLDYASNLVSFSPLTPLNFLSGFATAWMIS